MSRKNTQNSIDSFSYAVRELGRLLDMLRNMNKLIGKEPFNREELFYIQRAIHGLQRHRVITEEEALSMYQVLLFVQSKPIKNDDLLFETSFEKVTDILRRLI